MQPRFEDPDVTLYEGSALDVLRELPPASVDACVTSPPYLDARPEYPSPTQIEFTEIFSELRRIVRGPLLLNVGRLWRERREQLWWLNLLDSAAATGWPLADTLLWVKPNANPIQGEVLTNAHEYVFMLGDGFDPDAIRTPYSPESLERYERRFVANAGVKGHTRPEHRPERAGAANELGARPRSYLAIHTGKEKGNKHPAPMPLELAEKLVLLSGGQSIIDPFAGSGTTLLAARRKERRAIGVEISPEYCAMIEERLAQQSLLAA